MFEFDRNLTLLYVVYINMGHTISNTSLIHPLHKLSFEKTMLYSPYDVSFVPLIEGVQDISY